LEYCKVYTKQYCPGEFFDKQDVPDDIIIGVIGIDQGEFIFLRRQSKFAWESLEQFLQISLN